MQKLTVRYRLLTILLLLLLPSLSLHAQDEPVVREIVIQGLKTIKPEQVSSVMTSRVGLRSSPEMRREDLNSILALGFFTEDVKFYREPVEGGIRIIVRVRENPTVEEIEVLGNRDIKAARIIAELPFRKGDLLPTRGEIKARLAVEKLYMNGGYKNARIKVRTEEPEEGRALFTIIVDEGQKILVKDLVLSGNKSFSSFRLRFLLDNKGSWGFVKNYYDETTFDDDLDILSRFYTNRGFLDVVVRRGKQEYNEEKGWIRPVIEIEEGPRYVVQTVTPGNVTLFTQEEAGACFSSLLGRTFSASRFQKGMERLKRLYGDEGFIQMEAVPDFKRLPDGTSVDLVLDVRENSRVYVGKIKVRRRGYIRGEPENFVEKVYDKFAPPPKDEVVLREVTLKPEDVYRTFQEVRTVERLKRLEVFESVHVTREPTETENVRDMVINVREGDTGAFGVGIGYGENTGAFLQTFLRERNLFGDARDLRVSALLGTKSSSFMVGYLDRYFMDSDKSLAWNIYRDRNSLKSHTERIYGTSVEIGKPLSEYVTGYVRARLEHVNFLEEDDDILTELDSYYVTAIQFRLIEDRRDEQWWPTRGFKRGAGFETGYADGFLAKFTAEYSWYNQFYKEFVYALNAQAGLMPYDADKVGLTERFFLGGPTDLRGFSFRGAGPKDKGDDDLALGGSTKLLLQNELRYPIAGELKGLVFFDMGMLDESVGLDKPRASIGTGLRMKISVIRFGVDFAKAVMKEKHDDTRYIHIRVGAAF